MALTIIQQPQALTFVGNIPDLIAQTDGLGMTVNVSKGATLILAEYYTADEGGKARVALKDFLDDQLQLELPDPDTALFEQTKSWASFSVEIISGESTETISFVAIKGGSSTLNLDCPAYLLEAWLTWQPQIKKVKDIQPEWLSYFTQHAAVVKARGYFSGGTSEDVTLHTLEAGKHYTVNMTFADLREEFVLQPIYIDVWVENAPGGDPVFSTYRQRYVLSTEFFEFDDFFLFKNSVGGLDLIRFTGSRESTNPIEVDSALYYDEYQRDYQVTPSLAFEKNTGYFRSRAELLWSLDFFQAKEKYYQIEDAFTEIRLINPEFTAPENTLASLDFKFSYTRQTVYLSLFKKKSPLIDPVIIGPGDDDYYLPPDIGEFPQKTDPSGLLFPVQQPGTPGWFFITWENMLAEILENLPGTNHNELDGLQGGSEGERFHQTEEQHATAAGITRTLDEAGAADQYQFPSRVKGSPAVNEDEFVTKSQLPNIQQYGRISGGTIQWSGVGLTYNFSRAVLAITGECIAESGQVTLDPADDTFPRFDGLGWRKIADGIADRIKLLGEALLSPPFPQFNPETEVEGIFVSVPASATEPEGVTTENVYLENAEWAVSFAGVGTGDEDSTASPETDLYAIEATAIKNAFKVILDRGSVLDLNSLSDPTFGMGQKLKAALANNQNFDLIFLDGAGAPASNLLQLSLNKTSLSYQFVGVNLAEFQWTTRLIRYIEIRYRQPGNGTFAGAFFDNIKIQGGVAQPPAGTDGDKGWSPVLAVITDGERRVHQVIDWTGGQGAKPITGLYIGIDGLKVNIADGVDIRGAAGTDGADGAPGADGSDGAPGADGMDGTPGADGADGREVEIQNSGTHVQWRYVGDVDWIDLIALSAITGADGADGTNGTNGVDGADGTDGREIELQVNGSDMLQWRYVGDIAWTDLFDLTTLVGGGADADAVHYNAADGKSPSEKAQARENIGSSEGIPQLVTDTGTIALLTRTSNVIFWNGAADASLQRMTLGENGEEVTICNLSGTFNLIVQSEAGSGDGNRFSLTTGGNLIIYPGQINTFKYFSSRWRALEKVKFTRTTTFFANSGVANPQAIDIIQTNTGAIAFCVRGSDGGTRNFSIYGSGRLDLVGPINTGRINAASFDGSRFWATNSGLDPVYFMNSTGASTVSSIRQTGHLRMLSQSSYFGDSARIDQTRLYYMVSVTTAGVINDQALTAGIFNYRFTACTDLTGLAAPSIGTKITIHNDNTVDMIFRHQSVGSIAANRINLIGSADLLIPSKGKIEIIYCTGNRWELVSKNF